MVGKSTNEHETPGPVSRQGLYAYAATFSREAVDCLVDLMRNTRNESLKMGAAKALLDKCLPDLRAMEVSGEGGGAIKVQVVSYGNNDPLSVQSRESQPTGTESFAGPTSVPGAELAPEGKENNTGNKPTDQVG